MPSHDFYRDFLLRAVDPADTVMHAFVETMVGKLMEHYSDLSAKGGDHSRDSDYDERTRRIFEVKVDQSMLSHQLNGIFPTMRLMNILEAERLGPVPFSDIERRVYILAYLMHDVNKILKIPDLETQTREAIEEAKEMIADELRQCNVVAFLPEWETYLEDITYLVVNTQEQWGTHLNTYGWYPRLREDRVLELRRLCTYSDCIAYLVPAPSAIISEADSRKINTILAEMSENQLVFTYHQLREVRGLLTNVINDALVNVYTDDKKREDIWPYLFFSDGVVYIKRKKLQLALTSEQITGAVNDELRRLCADRIKQHAPGFKFDNKGIAKHPEYYFEFLSLEDYAVLLARFTISVTRNDVTVGPLAKLRQMQATGEIPVDVDLSFEPDLRAGMVSRFLSVVFITLLSGLDKQYGSLRERVEKAVVEQLGLTPYWGQSKAIPNKGGTEYRWFWLGLCYLRDHQGITDYKGRGNLLEVFVSTLRLVIEMAGDELRKAMPQKYLSHLSGYLDSVIEVPVSVRKSGALPDFAGEIARYVNAKNTQKKGGKELICTLCNSAYPTDEQSDNAVLFQPWVYKNKLSLYAGKNAGGVCAICALELMLRQILQKGELRLTGGKFEGLKMKYLTVYPNFFFTAETGALVRDILDQLEAINFFTVRRNLDGRDITIGSLLELDAFASPSNGMGAEKPLVPVLGDEDDREIDDEDNETSEAVQAQNKAADRSYIKYEPSSYPGLCFFGVKASSDDTDSASWAMPAFLALALPLITNTKIVISEMPLPLFSSGHDFLETVVFDAPHPFLGRLLDGVDTHKNRVRVNKVLEKLSLLTQVYKVNLETYAKGGKPEWQHLSGIVRDLETDPLYVFSYLREQERRGRPFASGTEDYIGIYRRVCKEILGPAICRNLLDMKLKEEPDMDSEEDLGNIQHCVDRYVKFYRVYGDESYSILRPIDIVAKAIINSPLENFNKQDLFWQIQGEMKSWLDRVRSRQAKGYAVFRKWEDIETKEADAIYDFISYFYEHVFVDYCQEERGVLRSRINRFKDGCEAYYTQWRRANRALEKQAQQQEEEQDTEKEPVA